MPPKVFDSPRNRSKRLDHETKNKIMSLPVAVIIIISFVVIAGALTLAGFVWAVQSKQFSIKQLNEGAKQIFDDEEPIGTPQDMLFKKPSNGSTNHH